LVVESSRWISTESNCLKRAELIKEYLIGKGSDLARYLAEHPSDSGEQQQRKSRPELKLKPDAVIEVDGGRVADALAALTRREVRNVVVKDGATNFAGVLVPIDRYVDLVGTELESARQLHVREDGRLEPAGLQPSEVELVDPATSWPTHTAPEQ